MTILEVEGQPSEERCPACDHPESMHDAHGICHEPYCVCGDYEEAA